MSTQEDYLQTSENKVRSIFMGTFFTILVLLLGVGYAMTWALLFLLYTGDTYPEDCMTLVSWDQALYIVSFISSALHLVSSIFQLIASSYDKESTIPKYIMGCRGCLNYLAGIWLLVGINVSYFKVPDDKCDNLKKLNLAYLITEWTILGSCLLFVCSVCICSMICKRTRKFDDDDDLSDEENDI